MEVDENVESDATVGDSDVESDASGSILNIPSSPEVIQNNLDFFLEICAPQLLKLKLMSCNITP